MPSSALATTSKPRASSSDIARQWLVTFGEICGREITPALAAIWANQLGEIAPDLLRQACDRLAKTWTSSFLPTPGNVRAQIDEANANGLQLEAEEEWRKALNVAIEFFQPDIGLYRNAPQLSQATWHALKVAGGPEHLQSCKREELQWARKRFVADYTLIHETRQVDHLLSNCEARRILAEVTGPAKPNPKQLKSPEPEGNLPSRAEVRTLLERIAEIPSEEEWESRKRDQKCRLEQWRVAHGLPAELTPEELRAAEAVGKSEGVTTVPKTPSPTRPQTTEPNRAVDVVSTAPKTHVSGAPEVRA